MLREISGTCVDTNPRGIKTTCNNGDREQPLYAHTMSNEILGRIRVYPSFESPPLTKGSGCLDIDSFGSSVEVSSQAVLIEMLAEVTA